MPRITNPGDISAGPGKAVSTDMDVLVLNNYAGGSGAGAFIPPGETTPRDGYPALPCRACGGAGGGVVPGPAGSVEETILTVGLPNANPAWAGFIPHFTTLADAIDAANTLMSADGGGNPGRAVRILVVGPTVETAVPIQIQVDGLIIEGFPDLYGNNGAITWQADAPLIDLDGHDDLVFRDLLFEWNGVTPPPIPPGPFRLLFTSTSSSTISRLTIDNCRCDGEVQGFLGPDLSGTAGGFEACHITRNYARQLLEFAIASLSITHPPFQGCVIRDNYFQSLTPSTLLIPAITLFGAGPSSNSTTIEGNLIAGFAQGISTVVAPSQAGTLVVANNVIGTTEMEAIYIEGNGNKVFGNSLFNVHTSAVLPGGIYVDGSNNVVDSNFVILDGNGTAIEIGPSGENNVCSQNDVTQDSDGEIVVRGAISVVTENKAKDLKSYGGNSTVSMNLVSPGGGMAIHGVESTIIGNNVADGILLAANYCTLTGNHVSVDVIVTGAATRCTIGDNKISGDINIQPDSARHVIEGNIVEGDMWVNSSNQAISGNIVRGASGIILAPAATDACTITGNKVLTDIQSGGNECTISGNRVSNNLAVNGNENLVTGNWVYNNLVVGGTDCTIEANKADLLILNGTRATVGDNKVESIVGNAPACTVSGNWVLANITMNGTAQYCTIGDNAAEQIAVNGPDSTIGDNVFGIDIQVGGTNCTISGNRGGGGGIADILVGPGGVGSTISGNSVAGSMDVQAINCAIGNNMLGAPLFVAADCSVTGNRVAANVGPGDIVLNAAGCTVVGNNIDGNIVGAAPNNIAVGNIVRGGTVLGVLVAGAWTINIDNNI